MSIRDKIDEAKENIQIFCSKKFNIYPHDIDTTDIYNIFKNYPRSRWYDIIKNLIWKKEKDKSWILLPKNDQINGPEILFFTPEDLKKEYFDFKCGDILTHKKYGGLYIAHNYITIDKRYEKEYFENNKEEYTNKLMTFGNLITCDGLNKNGIPNGFEWGDFTINDNTSSYHNFEHLDYEPKEGEFLYYLKKSIKGEIHWKDEWKLDNLGRSKTHIKYNANHRKVYESWFKEYD